MPEAPASYFATGLVAPNQPDVTGRRGDFYTTRVGSERAHGLLRQPRHGSRAWYCPFTLASGSDPRHETRVAFLALAVALVVRQLEALEVPDVLRRQRVLARALDQQPPVARRRLRSLG